MEYDLDQICNLVDCLILQIIWSLGQIIFHPLYEKNTEPNLGLFHENI